MTDSNEFTRIEPAPVALTAAGGAGTAAAAGRGRGYAFAAALALAVATAIIVLGRADAPPAPATAPTPVIAAPAPAVSTAPGAVPAAEEQASMAPSPAAAQAPEAPADAPQDASGAGDPGDDRGRAQAALERVVTLTEALATRAVERWGADDYARAAGLRTEGDAAYRGLDYAVAAQRYTQAQVLLEALDARADDEVAAAIARGAAAIAAGDAAAATAAYDLALAIAPGNADATAGRERAGKVDAVRALLADADAHAAAGRWEDARTRWREALALDPATDAATAGIRRADAALAGARFTQAMSAGFAALEAGRLDDARAGFERAQGLRPDAAEAREALAQVATRQANERIAALLQEAQDSVGREDWWPAVVRYDEALKIDPTLVAAKEGRTLARQRAALDVKLEQFLAHAERLQAAEVRAEAASVLANARALAPQPGPRLARQLDALDARLAEASTPVAVTLQSDEKTEVTVHRVGEMGRFRSREVSLTPGRYIAVGARDGYRDVRVEFSVVAGQPAAPVVISCTERIGFGAR